MTLPDITLPLIVGSGLICIIIAGWWAFYRPRLALYALVVWAQFGPFLTKVTGSKLVLYATYVLPVALLLITALALPRKSLRVPRSSIVLFLGVFIAILIIQAFNPSLPDPTMGLAELASKFMLHISFFLLGIWLVRSESDLKGLLWALAIAGAIGGVYALYQQFVGFPSFENAWATGRSFQGFNVYLDQIGACSPPCFILQPMVCSRQFAG